VSQQSVPLPQPQAGSGTTRITNGSMVPPYRSARQVRYAAAPGATTACRR